MLQTSTRTALPLIKQFEGCKLKSYLCPAGVWTIGYGRTTGVREGQHCSQAQAVAWLVEEYDAFERAVLKRAKVALNANQLGALVSFTYNVGIGAFEKSTLLRKLNAGDLTGAAAEFARWNKANARVLAGLTNRRKAEADLFRKVA